MWTCPNCGEQHEDHFSACWQCARGEAEHAAGGSAQELPAAGDVPRRLRSPASIIVRAAVGFALGVVFGGAVIFRGGASLRDALGIGAAIGAGIALVVAIGLWVLFPFQSSPGDPSNSENS